MTLNISKSFFSKITLLIVAALLLVGSMSDVALAKKPAKLSNSQLTSLNAQLSNAYPDHNKQAKISKNFSKKVRAGGCKNSLLTLSKGYKDFGKAVKSKDINKESKASKKIFDNIRLVLTNCR